MAEGILIGLIAGFGLLMLAASYFGAPSLTLRSAVSRRQIRKDSGVTNLFESSGVRLPRLVVAVAVAVAIQLLLGWPVMAVFAGFVVIGLPVFTGANESTMAFAAKTDAVATWLEGMRDALSSRHGPEATIINSATRAPREIRTELEDFRLRVEHGQPLREGLVDLADDLDHEISDFALSVMAMALEKSATEISPVLTSLATMARVRSHDMIRIHAERAEARGTLKLVVRALLGFFFIVLFLFRQHLEPFSSYEGQIAMGVGLTMMGGTLVWAAKVLQMPTSQRMLEPRRLELAS